MQEGPPVGDEQPTEVFEQSVNARLRTMLQEEGSDEFWPRLYSTGESLPMTSDLKRYDVEKYKAVLWFADTFGQSWIRDLVDWDLALRVSIGRKGRQEAVTALTGVTEQKARGFMRLLPLRKREG